MVLSSTNNEIEKALIASLVVDGSYINDIAPIISVEMLEDKALASIYSSMLKLYDNGIKIDIISLGAQMVKDGAKKRECYAYLTELSLKAANATRAIQWAKEVADMYMRRAFKTMALELVRMTADDTIDMAECLDYMLDQSNQITSIAKIEANNKLIGDVASKCITLLNERINARKNGQKTGISTGLDELDFILGGFKPKKLIILAARPAMGKTSLAVHFGNYAALKGIPSLIFSLEMPEEEVGDSIMLSHCDVDASRYRDGFINNSEMEELIKAQAKTESIPLRIDDSSNISIRELRNRTILAKKKHGIKLVIIDYIQLMAGKDKAGNREQEISSISRGLKQMANELDLTVIALSQLNRTVESRADKIPLLSDLRESGAIEQDADIVLFAYRPAYYGMPTFPNDEEQTSEGVGSVIVAKHRGGSLGSVYFGHDKAMKKIYSVGKPQYRKNESTSAFNDKKDFEDAEIPF